MVLQVNAKMLKRLGYMVIEAGEGCTAVDLFKKNGAEIDLVVLDMIMPGMGGGDVFEQIKKLNPVVKVLLTSGCDINGETPRVLREGCDGFIQKPYSLEELSFKIKDIISIV